MKLIPGSSFVYKERKKAPVALGVATWQKPVAPSSTNDLTEGETYVVIGIDHATIRGNVLYTFKSSRGQVIVKSYNSVFEAEEQLGV